MSYLLAVAPFVLGIAAIGWRLRRDRRQHEKPSCLGSRPGPQQRAENDCDYCRSRAECDRLNADPDIRPGGPEKPYNDRYLGRIPKTPPPRPEGVSTPSRPLRFHNGGYIDPKREAPRILSNEHVIPKSHPIARRVAASQALGAPYTPSPTPASSEDPYLAAAVANGVFSTYIDIPSAPDPTPDTSSSSDCSGGGGDFGGGGSDSSW